MSLLSVEVAYAALVHGAAAVTETERVPLRRANGRILAADLVARRTQPAFDASAMDGYALRAADAGAALRLVGESAAGRAYSGRLDPGETVRIFTGAPVPEGADAILIQENAERGAGGDVRALEPVVAGRHIRRAGADFTEGDVLLSAGTRLTPGAVALAASGGHPEIDVLRRPRVAVLATGDELVLPGEPVGPAQIVASNSFGIAALAEAAGAEVIDLGIARDEEAALAAAIEAAESAQADVLVTIGGASVGDHDLVGRAFAARGVALDFWKVAMRPGKPLMAGRLGAMRLVGLPGNPASSLVTATLFLKPLVQLLAGRPTPTIYEDGVLGADMPENDGRADFIRATLDAGEAVTPIVVPFGRQDSSLLSIYARANVLLVRPPHAPAARKGEACRFVRLD